MTGKINDRENYGGLSQNPPNYPGHVFTGGRPFKFFFRGQQIFNRNFCFCYLLKKLFQFTVIDITQKSEIEKKDTSIYRQINLSNNKSNLH